MADKDDDIEIDLEGGDDIEVELEDGTTPKKVVEAAKDKKEPRTRKPRVSPDLPDGPSPDEALAAAKAHAETEANARKAAEATANAERQRADNAEAARQRAVKESQEHQERANNTELSLLESSIASAESELASHQEAYERAAEAGEFKAMGAIQVKLSKAAAALDRLSAAKSDLEASPRGTTEGRVLEPDSQLSAQEKHLRGYGPAAQNFLRQHMDCLPPEFGGDASKYNKMMAGHHAAKSQGLAEGTSEYFKVIESHISPPAAVVAETGVNNQQATSKAAIVREAQPSAPPSREAPVAAGQVQRSTRSVTLTRDQQEMAKVSFPHLPEKEAYGQYARNLIELEAEGKIGRLTH